MEAKPPVEKVHASVYEKRRWTLQNIIRNTSFVNNPRETRRATGIGFHFDFSLRRPRYNLTYRRKLKYTMHKGYFSVGGGGGGEERGGRRRG